MPDAPKQSRNRAPRPEWRWSGMSIERWRADPQRVGWARRDPHFAEVLTILVNERDRCHAVTPALSEMARLGQVMGFDMAIALLRLLSEPPDRALPSIPADYTGPGPLGELEAEPPRPTPRDDPNLPDDI